MLENIVIVGFYLFALYPIWLLTITLITYVTSIFYAVFILKNPNDPKINSSYSPLIDSEIGVSILKPLMGADKYQIDNLESHFKLKYRKLQLVLCIQNSDDPIIRVVEELRAKYPHIDCEIAYDNGNDIINPMVSNMANGYDKIKYDYVWVSTSRIKAYDVVLNDLIIKANDPGVGIVHQVPYTFDESTFSNTVDKISFGGYFGRNYITLNVYGGCCLTGMSYLIKKKVLDDVGGLPFFGKYLAEDFFLATAVHDNGYRFKLSAYPAQQQAPISLKIYLNRMTRWLRLRLNMITGVVLLMEFMSESIPLATALALSINYLFNINRFMVFGFHLLSCFLLDFILVHSIQGGLLPVPFYKYIGAWIVRECMVLLTFINAITNPQRIKWGRRTYKVQLGGHTSVESEE